MDLNRWIGSPNALGVALAAALACGPAGAKTTKPPAAYAGGKCQLCHSVQAAGIEAKNKSAKNTARDLSGYRPAVAVPKLAAYLRQEAQLGENEHKLPFKGSDEELQAIIDWLGSLE